MKELHLLAISASPRVKGNSNFLLERAVYGAKETGKENLGIELYSFHGKRFAACRQCYGCDKTQGECTIKDDFQELRDKWLIADIIVYSVPVYHMSIPGQLKCFFDRLGQSLSKRYPSGRRGEQPLHLKIVGNIAQGMDLFAGQEHAIRELINHSLLMNCVPITGNTYIGGGGWTIGSRDTTKIESMAENRDPAALLSISAAESIGKRAVQLALILKTGCREHLDLLKREWVFQPIVERLDKEDAERTETGDCYGISQNHLDDKQA